MIKKFNMIKLIIFDWDDVFTLGSTSGYMACYHKALGGVGVRLSKQEEKRRIFLKWGKTHREEFRWLLKEHPALIDRACNIYEEHLFGETFLSRLSIFPGVIPLLHRLKKRYMLCIATGMHPGLLKRRIMPHFGIPNVFSTIISSYDIKDPKKQKPDPYMIQKILKIHKVRPFEAVMVGDAMADVEMARAAGVVPIVVLTGHLTKQDAITLKVEHMIDDVTGLEEMLKNVKPQTN